MKKFLVLGMIFMFGSFLAAGCYPVCEGDDCEGGCNVNVNCCNECPECQECPTCPECKECPECPTCPECDKCCDCVGEVNWMVLEYTGSEMTWVRVEAEDGTSVYSWWVRPDEQFVVKGNLGAEIKVYVNCQYKCETPCSLSAAFHTSCGAPLKPGDTDGKFVFITGESYGFDGPLCE